MTTTEDIRRLAMALPEVEEFEHFLLHVPLWKVRGRTFVGMGKGETTAVFCVSQQTAHAAEAADPSTYTAVRRQDARRSFLGVQIGLAEVSDERVEELVETAWREKAPKRVVAARDRDRSVS